MTETAALNETLPSTPWERIKPQIKPGATLYALVDFAYGEKISPDNIPLKQEGDVGWFAEEGLKQLLSLPDATVNLADTSSFRDRLVNNMLDPILARHPSKIAKIASILFVKKKLEQASKNAEERMIDSSRNISYWVSILSNMHDQLKNDPNVFSLIRKVYSLAKLPEPLDMEINMATAVVDAEDLTSERFLGIHRSMLQAQEIREHIKNIKDSLTKKQASLSYHTLCGLDHESQLIHFLTNPSYDPNNSILRSQERLRKG